MRQLVIFGFPEGLAFAWLLGGSLFWAASGKATARRRFARARNPLVLEYATALLQATNDRKGRGGFMRRQPGVPSHPFHMEPDVFLLRGLGPCQVPCYLVAGTPAVPLFVPFLGLVSLKIT